MKRQVTEAEDFLLRARSMNADELGWPVAVVLEAAEIARSERGIDVFDPFVAMARDPSASLYFSMLANELKKAGRVGLASGPMVWCHTLRATVNYRIRNQTRDIWRELSRGFPFAEDARDELLAAYGMWPNLDRLGEFPKGMEPSARSE